MSQHEDPRARAAIDRMAQRIVKASEDNAKAGRIERPVTHDEARRRFIPIAIKRDRRR